MEEVFENSVNILKESCNYNNINDTKKLKILNLD